MRYVDRSYDVPPKTTTTTDPYTGETKTQVIRDGYREENRTIEFTIKNQPYTKNANTTGDIAGDLFYNFRFKGHFQNESYWKTEPRPSGHWGIYYPAAEGAETIMSLSLEQMAADYFITDSITRGQIDFQVQALVGYEKKLDLGGAFSGERGDWSSTQTIDVGANSNSPTAVSTMNPTPLFTSTPISTGIKATDSITLPLTSFVGVIAVIVFLLVVLVLVLRRQSKPSASPAVQTALRE